MILSSEWQSTKEAFSQFLESLGKIRESVLQKQTEFDTHCARLNKKVEDTKSSASNKIVKLNVGGTKFQTSESTLLSVHESFFWCMLHSGDWKPDGETGEYFIDRSPDVFSLVLETMRQQQQMPVEGLSKFQVNLLQKDLDFYGLQELANAPSCSPPLIWSHHTSTVGGIQFRNNNQTALMSCGVKFKVQTRIVAIPFKDVLSAGAGPLQWRVTCTIPKRKADTAGGVWLQVMDTGLTKEYCALRVADSGVVVCSYDPTANTATLHTFPVDSKQPPPVGRPVGNCPKDSVLVVELLDCGHGLETAGKFTIAAFGPPN